MIVARIIAVTCTAAHIINGFSDIVWLRSHGLFHSGFILRPLAASAVAIPWSSPPSARVSLGRRLKAQTPAEWAFRSLALRVLSTCERTINPLGLSDNDRSEIDKLPTNSAEDPHFRHRLEHDNALQHSRRVQPLDVASRVSQSGAC